MSLPLRALSALCTLTMHGNSSLLAEIPRAIVWTLDSCFAMLGRLRASKNKHVKSAWVSNVLLCTVDCISKGFHSFDYLL